jgi:hypothetical protein
MGTLKLECVWQHRFETYEEAKATITAWVKHYNETLGRRPEGVMPTLIARRPLSARGLLAHSGGDTCAAREALQRSARARPKLDSAGSTGRRGECSYFCSVQLPEAWHMRTFAFHPLSIGAAVVLLAGWDGSQAPIGAQAAMPQSATQRSHKARRILAGRPL